MISIGAKLSETREKLDKTLKDVEKETKIRAKYLEALELNKFSLIPGDAYVKLFIREYADFLDIDPVPLIKEYEEEHEESLPSDKFAPMGMEAPRRKYPYILSVLSLMVVATGIVLWQMGWLSAISEKALIQPSSDSAKTQPASKSDKNLPSDEIHRDTQTEEPPAALLNEQQVVVEVSITGAKGSNVQVVVDGELKIDRHLKEGEVKEWSAQDSIELTISNPSAVQVVKDGELAEDFDEAEGPMTKIFTP